MSELRRRVRVIGPGSAGHVLVAVLDVHDDAIEYTADVPLDRLPPEVRVPNATFLAVVSGRQVLRVERGASAWKTIQDEVRGVLNREWDPIGGCPEDEYDSYIPGIYGLLARGAEEEEIAKHLCAIERDRMGLDVTKETKKARRDVARRLRELRLPRLQAP